MADVELVARGSRWAMRIRKIASHTMSARGSIMLVVARGESLVLFGYLLKHAKCPSDPNCGAAFNAAADDTIAGTASGCGKTNPNNAAVRPNTSPVCS